MQPSVMALWSLLEAQRGSGNSPARDAAAGAAAAVLAAASQTSLLLTLDDARVRVDGASVDGDTELTSAAGVVAELLCAAGVAAVRVHRGVAADELTRWAEAVVNRQPLSLAMAGIDVTAIGAVGAPGDQPTRLQRPSPAGEAADSRLRSVFLQHRLIAGLPAIAGVDPTAAKLVVQGVVDRLLQLDAGLDPLMILQRDETLLQRSTAVAVLTVLFARRAGWPTAQLADLGVGGMLHSLGEALDRENPGAAGFRWLLDRGEGDCWLRSALVARYVGRPARREAVAEPPDLTGAVGLVRLAAATYAAGDDAEQREHHWRHAVDAGVSGELLAVARSALTT